jgi:hypothetical protein
MLPYCINSISFSAYSTLDHFEEKKFGKKYADFYVQGRIPDPQALNGDPDPAK